jgi:hypothetical protein
MRAFLLSLAVLAVVSCGTGAYWRSGEYREYWSTADNPKETRNVALQKIYYSVDRGEHRFLGVLEKNEIRLAGAGETRLHYIIFDRHHRKVGFISAEGELYRYDETGRLQSMGEFPILMKGLMVFFGFPLSSRDREVQIFLRPVDPYGDF